MKQFHRDESGSVAIIVSLMLVVLLGFTALGVDVAYLYRERAQLQSVGDLAAVSAMAAPATATERATMVLGRNGQAATDLDDLQLGRFLRNPAIPAGERFTMLPAGSPGINAVKLRVTDDAALHFAQIFTDDTSVALNRTSLATRTGAASFALDSHILTFSGPELDRALTQRFGGSAAIGVGNAEILAATSVNLGDIITALADQTGSTAPNPAEILSATVGADDLVAALASQVSPTLADSLTGLQAAASGTAFDVAALVRGIDPTLGLTATDFVSDINLSALDVVAALAADSGADQGIDLDADAVVPGVLSVQTALSAGEPAAESGWIALGEEGVQLHRAAVSLTTNIVLEGTALGSLGVGIDVVDLNLPITTEVAGSTATLETISCNNANPGNVAADFSTARTPLNPANGTAVAALYLGELPANAQAGAINPADLGFADLLTLDLTVDMGLLPDITIPGVTVQARSAITVGASRTDAIAFTFADVAAGDTTRIFGSGNLLTSATNSLLSSDNTEIRIKPGQDGLITGLAAPLVAGVLNQLPNTLPTALAPTVDGILDQVLENAGVALGAGELTLTGHHCEPIRLAN